MGKRRALVSVADKTGIVEFCQRLIQLDFEIISTGGTLKALAAAQVPARPVSEITGVPEILDGRVKTLDPTVFGGILARRHMAGDLDTLTEHGMEPIDVVAVNLYPFDCPQNCAKGADEATMEQIDIGGPALLRAAAKNYRDVYVVVETADYGTVADALGDPRQSDFIPLRQKLAAKVFAHTADYDRRIHTCLAEDTGSDASLLPKQFQIDWPLRQTLRYGENPHQAAAFYADPQAEAPSLAHCTQLQGKELSYNNFLDGETALEMIREFEQPACVILKHLNPCGAAWADDTLEAYKMALACDPTAAFGGIVGVNRPLDGALAAELKGIFLEVVIAPSFTEEALQILGKKKNLRLLQAGSLKPRTTQLACKGISGGLLVQQTDTGHVSRDQMKVASKTQPTEEDWQALQFAWTVCKWVKSNAIVYTDRQRTLGLGVGQVSRIDAARFGLQKADGKVSGGYLASDAFFPFRDVVDLAAEAGVRAIIQPGGSMRDDESIAAADEHGMIMVMTGMRHFRH